MVRSDNTEQFGRRPIGNFYGITDEKSGVWSLTLGSTFDMYVRLAE